MKKILEKKTLETTVKQLGEKFMKQDTELGQVMNNLDSDELDVTTGMSMIDMNARLSEEEINSSLIVDELMRLGIMPSDIGLTRQKKRLSVSKNGLGRQEKVQIVQGERDSQQGGGFFKRMFSKQP